MENRKTVFRLWFAWNFEKEERWLNSMAMDGWLLERVGFCVYYFVRCVPGEYIIRLEMHGPDDGYFSFMYSTGAELIGTWFQWSYFRRKSELGEFDLFSDIDSRVKHLDHIANVMRIVGIINIIIGVINSWHPAHLGIINLLLGSVLMYGLGRIRGKEEELRNERSLHE